MSKEPHSINVTFPVIIRPPNRLINEKIIMTKFFTIILLGLSLTTHAQKESIDPHQLASDFAQDYPGISIAVSQEGKTVWSKQLGFQDLENKIAVTEDTKFNIYSTSKVITGLAFLKLDHLGKLPPLDTKVQEIDPELPTTFKDISLRQVLTHTSGIRHYQGRKDWLNFSNLRCASPAEALAYFAKDNLKATPGSKEIYTTFGLVLASHLLEKITQQPYIESLNAILPLSSPLELDSEQAEKAVPYFDKGKKRIILENLSAECKYGGGGLIATAQQLAEIGKLLYSEDFIPESTLKAMISKGFAEGRNRGPSYAIGTGRTEMGGKKDVIFTAMGGGSPGGRSYLLTLVDFNIAVAITGNVEGNGQKAYELAIQLAKHFAGI